MCAGKRKEAGPMCVLQMTNDNTHALAVNGDALCFSKISAQAMSLFQATKCIATQPSES